MTSGIEFPAMQHRPLDQIHVGLRYRQDMGDLQVLADS
jgi:hypothetical protein